MGCPLARSLEGGNLEFVALGHQRFQAVHRFGVLLVEFDCLPIRFFDLHRVSTDGRPDREDRYLRHKLIYAVFVKLFERLFPFSVFLGQVKRLSITKWKMIENQLDNCLR